MVFGLTEHALGVRMIIFYILMVIFGNFILKICNSSNRRITNRAVVGIQLNIKLTLPDMTQYVSAYLSLKKTLHAV